MFIYYFWLYLVKYTLRRKSMEINFKADEHLYFRQCTRPGTYTNSLSVVSGVFSSRESGRGAKLSLPFQLVGKLKSSEARNPPLHITSSLAQG